MTSNLLFDILRGPVHIQNTGDRRQKYFRHVDNCFKCFKHSASKSPSQRNNRINISENLQLHHEEENQTPFPMQSIRITNLQRMQDQEAKQDRNSICLKNIQLGSRMHYSYKNTERSIMPFTNRPKSSETRAKRISRGMSLQENNSSRGNPEDNVLASSAIQYLHQSKQTKMDQEWNDFRSQYPSEAKWIDQVQHMKRKLTTKRETQSKRDHTQNSNDKTPFRRRQSQTSSNRQTHKLLEPQDAQFQYQDVGSVNSDITNQEIVLEQNFMEQPDIVLSYLLNGQRFCPEEEEILQKWIHTLPQEQRMEIVKDKKFFAIPRNIDQTSIRQGLDKLFGIGKQRRLRPGEEALLLETIHAYLEESLKNPQMLGYSITYILNTILKQAGLEELIECPLCMKQLECHWKLMATRFRYSGNPLVYSKKLEKFLQVAQARGHFLDLTRKDSPLVQFLLRNQSKTQSIL